MRMPSLSRLALSAVATFAVAGAWADEAAPSSHTLGAGVLLRAEMQPYTGVGTRFSAIPLLDFENDYIRFFATTLDLKLQKSKETSFFLRAHYADTGYQASDSTALAGMAERKNSLWLGAKGEWRTSVAQLSGEWLADGSRHSRGQQVKVMAETLTHVGPVGVVPRLALVWQDRKYVNYHYGVGAAEALAGRPAYAGKAALNTELGVQLFGKLAPRHAVFVDLSATALGASIKDSPLVDRSWVSAVRVGYVYSF
jgi:outer membrane protein